MLPPARQGDTMTPQQMLDRLLALAGTQQFLARDFEGELADVQDQLAQLIVELANQIPEAPARIAREFPTVFGN